MSRAILYSFYAPENPAFSPTFVMLKNSLETLRKHNQEIPVLVYLSPTEYKNYFTHELAEYNVQTVIHEEVSDPRLDTMFTRLGHKWPNIFNGLKQYKEILYVDCDTMFFDDPKFLFDKYTDPTKVYTRGTYLGGDFLKFFQIEDLVMNDGQSLIRDNFLKFEDEFINRQKDYVLEKIDYLNTLELHEDEKAVIRDWINWSGTQYGISLLLHEMNAFAEFDIHDVALFPDLVSLEDMYDLVFLHYFNYNINHVLPQKYLDMIDDGYKQRAENIQQEWTWDV